MAFDIVIRGGRVVDGSGLPGFLADVAIEDGRIARIGRVREDARRVIDADGAVVTPGFVDVHTHYDVQLDWDPIASPSCWHGVTTVLTGNCGFTLAPAKREDVPWLAAMLSREGALSAIQSQALTQAVAANAETDPGLRTLASFRRQFRSVDDDGVASGSQSSCTS